VANPGGVQGCASPESHYLVFISRKNSSAIFGIYVVVHPPPEHGAPPEHNPGSALDGKPPSHSITVEYTGTDAMETSLWLKD